MTQENATVLYAVEDGVARITLNRPDKRNALNDELISRLKEALRKADHDESVRAATLLGSGADFCSGADLSALQKMSKASVAENLEDARSLMELFLLIREVRVPVIAAVQGRALAGGCGLALACDMVLASRSARFGFPEVKIGFVAAMVMAILCRNVSEKKAFELVTTGDEVTAEEGERLALVNRVFDDETFATDAQTFVKRFERNSKSAVGLSKRLLYQIDGQTLADAMYAGVDINATARMTEDCQKGIERFLRKS